MRLFNLLVHISRFLLNLYCPLSAAIFWLKHHGKKSNTTDKLEISWGDGDGDGDGASVVELRFSWIHLAAVSSHLSPESACRDSRNSQTSDIFFLKYTFFMHSHVIQESSTTKFTISNVQVSWNQIVLEIAGNAQSHRPMNFENTQSHRRILKSKFHHGIPLT